MQLNKLTKNFLKKNKKKKSSNTPEQRTVKGASLDVDEEAKQNTATVKTEEFDTIQSQNLLSIKDYCVEKSLNQNQVWQLIHQGKVEAKRIDQQVFIHNPEETNEEEIKFEAAEEHLLNTTDHQTPNTPTVMPTTMYAPVHEQTDDKRAFLNYLATVKEENKQVLSLTQQVLQQMQHMNSKVESLQAEVLEMKTQENKRLSTDLDKKEQETNNLKQEMEDLKLLLKTFESDLNI